jgi:hypothetical protein
VKPASEQVYQLRFDYRELCQCVSWFSR